MRKTVGLVVAMLVATLLGAGSVGAAETTSGSLELVVVTPDRTPVVGASVSMRFPSGRSVSIVTDADGRAVRSSAEIGVARVLIDAPGHLIWSGEATVAAGKSTVLHPELAWSAAAAGRITLADGTPVANVRVDLHEKDVVGGVTTTHQAYHGVRTDQEGRWSYPRVTPRAYQPEIVDEDHLYLPRPPELRAVARRTTTVDAVASPGGLVKGRVVDLEGRPLPTASTALLWIDDHGVEQWARNAWSRVEPDGTFVYRQLPPRSYDTLWIGITDVTHRRWSRQDEFASPGEAISVRGGQTIDLGDIVLKDRAPHATTAPSVKGTPRVGGIVRVDPGRWDLAGLALTYQWRVDGRPIAGATGTSLRVQPGHRSRRLSVVVTARKEGHFGSRVTTARSAAVKLGTLRQSTGTRITGTTRVGRTLRAHPGRWSPEATRVRYQWRADGKAIPRATRSTFRLTSRQAGKRISVKVTASRTGYATATRTTKGTRAVRR